MAVIHIPEEEAAKSLSSLLSRAANGEHIVIDSPGVSVRLVPDPIPSGRTGNEMLAILDHLPGERGAIDEDFARDVLSFRDRHQESLDISKWD